MLSGEPLKYCETRGRLRKVTTSKMFAYVFPNRLFPTMLTALVVGDGINRRCVYWD